MILSSACRFDVSSHFLRQAPCEEECPCTRGFIRRRVTCRLNQGSGSALLGDESDGDGDGNGDDDDDDDDDAHDGGKT